MENKSGHKTSEFYMAIGTILSLLLAKYVGIELDAGTLAAVATTAGSYIVSRGVVKK